MKHLSIAVAFCGGLLLAVGCAPTQLGENYGEAYYTMIENQILDPKAGQTQEPVEGMDGKAAMISIEEYRNTFKDPDANFGKSTLGQGLGSK